MEKHADAYNGGGKPLDCNNTPWNIPLYPSNVNYYLIYHLLHVALHNSLDYTQSNTYRC